MSRPSNETVDERYLRVLRLKAQGHSVSAIAGILGITHSGVHKLFSRAAKRRMADAGRADPASWGSE